MDHYSMQQVPTHNAMNAFRAWESAKFIIAHI